MPHPKKDLPPGTLRNIEAQAEVKCWSVLPLKMAEREADGLPFPDDALFRYVAAAQA